MSGKLLLVAHILACGFFYCHVVSREAGDPSWVSEYDGGSALDGPLSKQYLYAFYWSLTTMSTVGYGDITPANDLERAFATFSLVVGALSFAFINGNVVGLLSSLDNQSVLVEEKLEAVKEYAPPYCPWPLAVPSILPVAVDRPLHTARGRWLLTHSGATWQVRAMA